MTINEKLKQLLSHHNKLPMSAEYKEVLCSYTKAVYMWIPKINSMIKYQQTYAEDSVDHMTAYGMKLISQMKEYIENICEIRTYYIIISSIIVLSGFNFPTRQTIDKFKKLLQLLDDAMLDNMVILQGFKDAINNHKRFGIKKYKKPMSIDEIKSSEYWVEADMMWAFAEHGQKVLDLSVGKPYNKK